MAPVVNDCYNCRFHFSIPGDCHIGCSNPDMSMTGHPHGIKSGWFLYPLCFDPVWMTKKCCNFSDYKTSSKA